MTASNARTAGRGLVTALCAGLVLVLTAPGWAGIDEGKAAYSRGDYATAVRQYRPLAENGDANAQYNLGIMYAKGRGVPRDDAKAVQWLRKAAEQGFDRAQLMVGVMYAEGRGVPQDYVQGHMWIALAVAGSPPGKAREKAVKYRDLFATEMSPAQIAEAQHNLGSRYAEGRGVPRDDATAVQWYRKAAEQGHANAQYNLGFRYAKGRGVPQDYAKAVRWHRKAAERGFAKAPLVLAFLYELGKGVPQNYAKAAQWYRKAAEKGIARAQFGLGLMYAKGRGVPQDYVQGHMWIALAVVGFSPGKDREKAVRTRDLIATDMSPAQIAKARKLAREWRPKR